MKPYRALYSALLLKSFDDLMAPCTVEILRGRPVFQESQATHTAIWWFTQDDDDHAATFRSACECLGISHAKGAIRARYLIDARQRCIRAGRWPELEPLVLWRKPQGKNETLRRQIGTLHILRDPLFRTLAARVYPQFHRNTNRTITRKSYVSVRGQTQRPSITIPQEEL